MVFISPAPHFLMKIELLLQTGEVAVPLPTTLRIMEVSQRLPGLAAVEVTVGRCLWPYPAST
jgi:hypothetical protein